MASLPFSTTTQKGITVVTDVDKTPSALAAIIESHLSCNNYVWVRGLGNEPISWTPDGLRDGLGLQSAGIVKVKSKRCSFAKKTNNRLTKPL
jgi:hypothetical protein